MLRTTKINLLGRSIGIELVDMSGANELISGFDYNSGVANYERNLITIEKRHDAFVTLLHEIAHFWLQLTGQYYAESYNREMVVEFFGRLATQLILENGADIFKKLKLFCE